MSVSHVVTCDRCSIDCTTSSTSIRLGKGFDARPTDLCQACYLVYEQVATYFMNRHEIWFETDDEFTKRKNEFEAKKAAIAADVEAVKTAFAAGVLELQKGLDDEKAGDSGT